MADHDSAVLHRGTGAGAADSAGSTPGHAGRHGGRRRVHGHRDASRSSARPHLGHGAAVSRHVAIRDAAVARRVRALLVGAAVLVSLAGLQLTIFPTRTADWFPWTIDVAMSAVFLGAAYLSGAVLAVAGARSTGWGGARLAVVTVLVVAVLTFVASVARIDELHLGGDHPTSARLVAWGWLAACAGVPVAMVVALVVQARDPVSTQVARRPLPGGLRALLLTLVVALLGTGAVMLASPTWVADLWSWPVSPLTAGAVGAWLAGLGCATAHAYLLDDVERVRPLGLTMGAFVILQAVALVRQGDAMDWLGWQAVGYVVVLACMGAVSAWIELLRAADATGPGSSR